MERQHGRQKQQLIRQKNRTHWKQRWRGAHGTSFRPAATQHRDRTEKQLQWVCLFNVPQSLNFLACFDIPHSQPMIGTGLCATTFSYYMLLCYCSSFYCIKFLVVRAAESLNFSSGEILYFSILFYNLPFTVKVHIYLLMEVFHFIF